MAHLLQVRFTTDLTLEDVDRDLQDLPAFFAFKNFVQVNSLQDYMCLSVGYKFGAASTPKQVLCLYNKAGAQSSYTNFFCSCGYSRRAGIPCRHFLAVLVSIPQAAFHLGLLHEQWFKDIQPPSTACEMISYDRIISNAAIKVRSFKVVNLGALQAPHDLVLNTLVVLSNCSVN